ncbi:MAG: ABC transporter permease [Gemmatimonadales bacterium]|jgi:putative ABC transport system permease protein
MDSLLKDIRYSLRTLLRNPGFATVAIMTIGLGIGVNTAIFSVVNAVVLQPLPFPEPDRLVTVWEDLGRRGGPEQEWTGRSTFADWREHNRTFEAMTAVTDWAPNLTGSDRPERLNGARVSPGYFTVLGIEPAAGRDFLAEEETPGNHFVVIISHELWQRRFGGDPDVLGSSLTLNGAPHTVVGILRPGFRGPIVSGAEMWAPLPIDPTRDDHGNYFLRVIGRLASGVSFEAAGADMDRVAAGIAEANPLDYRDVGVALVPLRETVAGPVRTALLVLLGAVGLILLIACANVANLLLARASVRERELAVRGALGAGPLRLARQLLTESVILALAGGSLGILLGVWGTALLVRFAPAGLPRASEIGLHADVLVFALGASVLTGLLFGMAPVLSLPRSRYGSALREGGRGASSAAGGRLRNGLVVVQLALGMSVLTAAGLLLRSFAELRGVDPGFRVENTLSGRLFFSSARYEDPADIAVIVKQLEDRLGAAPGVASVGAVTVLPLSGLVHDINFGIETRMPEAGNEPAADLRRATPGFFETMGVPLLQGRVFDEGDRADALPVTIISESMAEKHFRDESPIGQRIKVGGVRNPESPWWTIVGVVGSVRSRALDRIPEPEIYLPVAQRPPRGLSFVVRAEGDPAALVPAFREAIWSVDADMPVSQLATLEDTFAASLAPQRFLAWLLGAFAALALLLGSVGIYGVMAYMVSRRTREIGIRMALGARPADVMRDTMTRGLALTAGGLALGAAGALAASRALTSLLFEISPTDPMTLGVVATLLAGTALFACYWPARRATRVDPMVTLRYE